MHLPTDTHLLSASLLLVCGTIACRADRAAESGASAHPAPEAARAPAGAQAAAKDPPAGAAAPAPGAAAPARDAESSQEPRPAQAAQAPAERDAKPQGVTWTQGELEAASLEIQKHVEELRGHRFESVVPVKLSSKDQFVEYALARTEQLEPASKRASDEAIQKMLGLIPPGMDLLEESMRLLKDQVGGFYDPATKTFYLMDNCPQALARIVLAHELGHALDDQLYDIDGQLRAVAERSDAALAYQAVVEGSGTAVMGLWAKEHAGMADLLGMGKLQEEQTASMASAPMSLWKPLLAAYLRGQTFLARTESIFDSQKSPPKNSDIDQAFRDPPRSTEQILHPEKYWDAARRDDPVVVEQKVENLPEGWEVLRRDVVGELSIAIWCIPPGERAASAERAIKNAISTPYTSPAAAGWAGDELVLLGKGDDARALRWSTRWDTERDAAEFYGAASVQLEGLEHGLSKLARGRTALATADVRYEGGREVVIELGYGAKRKEWEPVFAAIGSD